uniref:Ankyrin-3-like n=1 Tax=Dermatophagoides pteronyssinus TaxID=6956 RepID=A0A6P6YGD1_DERPT|nr:ankyrin-3-like [Dermatophagoides pteronyssinus]
MAAQENHDGVVKYLLANGANQSLATEDGFTPLAVALQQGHDRVVAVLLENDTKGKVRLPALHVAAKKDDCKAATLLLQNDHYPDVTSKSGFTPLHIASHYGNENIAALLLEKNADVNFAAKHQITPLHVAAKWGKVNMVSLLLDYKAKIDSATQDGLTPLHCAARSGHKSVVQLLIERGAPISPKTKNGLAPLHMAAQGDHVDCAKVLLDYKAPVDDVTVDYLTPLHVASHCGHVRVAKLLLDKKADPNARALNGFTPLHIACKKNRIKVVELLLKHGASIEATTESGLTPLHVASFMGCMNIVIYLIQHMANPDVQTIRGETPLHLAARANQTDIIRVLLRNGAQVDAKARENQTPLHIAARLGNSDIVSLLLQHGASIDAITKDQYTALHIATKEGHEETASILIDNGASLTAQTKKGFTPLHLAAKYGNIKVARLLISRNAPVDAQGKNNVTPLHCAAHYDHVNIALLLLEEKASPHATAKNGYTPLHIAARKNQIDIATTLLEYAANPNAESKAGFIPLHLAAQEGHSDMVALLLHNRANVNAKSKNGLTSMHLCAQNDRVNVASILAKNNADISSQTKEGYTPLHAAAHFGQMNMVRFLLKNGANVDTTNCHGYTPLHQAAQQGHVQIVNLLLEHKASPNVITNQGQTALSIAQKLGYISVVETLKVVTETIVTTTTTTITEEKYKVVSPEIMHESFMSDSEDEGGDEYVVDTAQQNGGQTTNQNGHTGNNIDKQQQQQKQKHPSTINELKLSRPQTKVFTKSTEELLVDNPYRYLTGDEMKFLGDDSLPIDVTKDERMNDTFGRDSLAPITIDEELISPQYFTMTENYVNALPPDNIDLSRAPVNTGTDDMMIINQQKQQQELNEQLTMIVTKSSVKPLVPYKCMARSRPLKWRNFLVSFMVDARGGAMRGCRHSGVRVIIPPRKAPMPMRITCRYVKREKLIHPPPLMEGEACASRILEMGPSGAKFLGPVIIEVPHFASLRGKERDIVIFRSDNGETWREHTLEATEEAVLEVLNASFDGENGRILFSQLDVNGLDDFHNNRITRILTTDFPQYFAIITRIRQEVHAIGPEGGILSSTVVPQVQAIFPEGALTKKIKVGLQAQPIPNELVTKLLGNRVAVSPICTIEPRRRKFHKPITLTIPLPQAANRGMINQYSVDTPTLRLLCSITGGSAKAQWEDVTGSTPLTFVNSCVSFTTTVSARFWLIDCREINNATKYATELYQESVNVPFMAKFVVFAKRLEQNEAQVRVFCMTDDKEDKTLEHQEHFTEIAKSRDVEVLENKAQFLEFAGNLTPVTKSGEQLYLIFNAFRENRLPFLARVKDLTQGPPSGRIAFMRDSRKIKSDHPQQPICTLNLTLPEIMTEIPVKKSESFSNDIKMATKRDKRQIDGPMTNGFNNHHDEIVQEPHFETTTTTTMTTTTMMNVQPVDNEQNISSPSSSTNASISMSSDDQKKKKKQQQQPHQQIVEQTITATEIHKDVADTMTKPEMETWQSIEQDTSQVSVTSLPDDEKSEQSLTISSNVNDDNESTIVKQKEWTELDDNDGVVKHIQQTTVKSQQQSVDVQQPQQQQEKIETTVSQKSKQSQSNTIKDDFKMDIVSKQPSFESSSVVETTIIQKPQKISETISIVSSNNDNRLDDIKREAITITTNVVERAKNELSKKSMIMPMVKKFSEEISDEDMVEKGKRLSKSPATTPTTEMIKPMMDIVSGPGLITAKVSTSKSSGLRISPSREEIKEIMMSSSESSQQFSDQYRTPTSSRPQSSEYDNIAIIPESMSRSGSHISSEYVTCPTMTRDSSSFHTIPSQELTSSSQYYTPQSNLSSKTSSQSIETVESSSSNIGDLSETSETIVHDDDDDHNDHIISPIDNDGNYFDEHYHKLDQIDTSNIEPFNYDIPSSMLKNDIDEQSWLTKPRQSSSSSSSDVLMQTTTLDRSQQYYVEPYENPEPVSMSSFYTQKTTTTTTTASQQQQQQPQSIISSQLECIDKNLYTHVEVEEDISEGDNSDSLRKYCASSGGNNNNFQPSSYQASPKNMTNIIGHRNIGGTGNTFTETETTSSTSSSLKEFERLESEMFSLSSSSTSNKDQQQQSQSQQQQQQLPSSSTRSSAMLLDVGDDDDDFQMSDSKQLNLESIQSENILFDEQEDFNPESLNSELSQVTCIKISNNHQRQQQQQQSSSDGGGGGGPQLIDEFDPLVPLDHQQQQPATMLDSMDSNLNPVLDCDFSSLGSSSMSMSAVSMERNNNDTVLQCDDINLEQQQEQQPHPALIASMSQSIEQASTASDDHEFVGSYSADGEEIRPTDSRIMMTETTTTTMMTDDDDGLIQIEHKHQQQRRKSSSSSTSSSSTSSTSSSSSNSDKDRKQRKQKR